MKWKPPKWFESLVTRHPRKQVIDLAGTIACRRCRRSVRDTERGRNSHRVSCVRIPRVRSKAWGVKV